MNTKTCRKCGREMPATTEFFYRDTRYKEPFRSPCKECCAQKVDKTQKSEYNKAYVEAHKKELEEYGRQYQITNKEKIQEYRHSHRNKLTESHAAYVKSHKEQVYANNRKWEEDNREKRNFQARTHDSKRRAAKKNNGGSHTHADVIDQYARQKGKCYWCGKLVGEIYHVDHIIPLLRGGTNDPDNLVISCPTCNCKKSWKMPHEWTECGRLL